MIKNKGKIASALALAFITAFCGFQNTQAVSITGGVLCTGNKATNFSGNSVQYSDGTTYQDTHFQMNFNFNGTTHTVTNTYCIDVGAKMSCTDKSLTFNCERIDNAALQMAAGSLTGNHVYDQLLLRAVAMQQQLSKTVKSGTHADQILDYFNGKGGLSSTDATLNGLQSTYQDIINSAGDSSGDPEGTNYVTATQTSTSTTGDTHTSTYSVTSRKALTNVSFDCESSAKGCKVTSSTWNGTSGSFTVQSTGCEETVRIYYDVSSNYPDKPPIDTPPDDSDQDPAVYICRHDGLQQLLVIVDSDLADDLGNNPHNGQTIPGEEGGSGKGTKHEKIPVKFECGPGEECNETTKVNIPSLCDETEADQTASITAPKNVKACILKGNDEAGNSYRDTAAVNESNPYCSVYCKEDYEMTLPGARFTTSGEYFELNNTQIKGTRTCYATSGDDSDEDEKGIDIKKYNADMISAQQALVNAYNEYSRTKSLYENRGQAQVNSGVDACGNSYTNYTLNVKYNSYSYNCNELTGKCTISNKGGTASARWGTEPGPTNTTYVNSPTQTSPNCVVYPGGWSCPVTTCSTPVSVGTEPEAPNFSAVASANNQLDSIIEKMENCYSWENNFCFQPEIEFEYDEEYNSELKDKYGMIEGPFTEKDSKEYGSGQDIDDEYTVNGGSLVDVDYIGCDTNGCDSNGHQAEQISNTDVKFIKNTKSQRAVYGSKQLFQTNYPHGTIETVTDPSAVRDNYEYLGAVFPVALKTTPGKYNWNLKFEKIGQYNSESNCSLGRLNDVAKKLNNTNMETELQYVCVYVVDEDIPPKTPCDCTTQPPREGYTCVQKGDQCDWVPEGGACDCDTQAPQEGKTCVQNGNQCDWVDCPDCNVKCSCSSITVPNGKVCVENAANGLCEFKEPDHDPEPQCENCDVYCANCIFNGTDTFNYRTISLTNLNPNGRTMGANWTNNKGLTTLKEIEENNEQIYKEPEYSYTLTPTNMKNIRDFNKSKNSYIADDLTYQRKGDYKNAYGISAFLDSGQENGFFTQNKRNTNWQLWTDGVAPGSHTGPSWK